MSYFSDALSFVQPFLYLLCSKGFYELLHPYDSGPLVDICTFVFLNTFFAASSGLTIRWDFLAFG